MLYPISDRWRADHDVIDRTEMCTRLGNSRKPPHGYAWLIVGTRRSGKTWTLDAIAHHFGTQTVDLRNGDPLKPAHLLLIDEPGKRIEADARGFAEECGRLHHDGTMIVLALTPVELMRLRAAAPDDSCFSHKSFLQLPPVTDTVALKIARNPQDEDLVRRLPVYWRRNLYLLQVLLHEAETVPVGERVVETLCAMALVRCASIGSPYLASVFGESLTEELRDTLRKMAHGEPTLLTNTDELARLGLIARDNVRSPWRIENPALHTALAPLRIHHLSDVHVGPKTATEVDIRFGGVVANDLGRASAAKDVRTSYLAHLRSQQMHGQGPHLVLLTGDLTEFGNPQQYDDLRGWLGDLLGVVKSDHHPCLLPDTPRMLIAGGNHDVDWGQTAVGTDAHLRHVRFAKFLEHFGGDVAHPHLERPVDIRKLSVVDLPDAELSIVLLGSAELGGQVIDDPLRAELVGLAEKLPLTGARRRKLDALRTRNLIHEAVSALFDGLTGLSDEQQKVAQKIRDHVSRVDPSLVHTKVIDGLRTHRWRAKVRIAALHHPVSHVGATEVGHFTAMTNANALKDALLQRGFALVLHGHIHAGRFVAEEWPDRYPGRTLRFASAPSLGSSEIAANNGYNEVTLLRDLDDAGQPTVRMLVQRVTHQVDGSWTIEKGARMGPFDPPL